MHLLKKQLRWSWIILSKNGVLNIHMRYAHGEIIGKNWLCSLISLSGLERLSISLILLKIWMGRLESTPKISYHFRMIMRWKNLSIWPLTKSKRNGTNLFGIGHWYLTNLLLYLKTGFKYKTRILKFSIYTKSWTVPGFSCKFPLISVFCFHLHKIVDSVFLFKPYHYSQFQQSIQYFPYL